MNNYKLQTANYPLLVIVGETASGKSALALELAKKFNGEIICADSRTIYKGMDIGTAKPSKEDQAAIPHHLLDIRTLDQKFTVADFKKLANEAINPIYNRGKLPILVGGTGLYIDAVIFDYKFSETGAEKDEQNPRHLKQAEKPEQKLRANTLVLGIDVDHDVLRGRIEMRAAEMLQTGLVKEAEQLARTFGWDNQLLQTIGYKELQNFMNGQKSIDEVEDEIIMNTVHYAKRQRTWFKRNKSIQWVAEQREAVKITRKFLSKFQ